jgi:hypothetical protein
MLDISKLSTQLLATEIEKSPLAFSNVRSFYTRDPIKLDICMLVSTPRYLEQLGLPR